MKKIAIASLKGGSGKSTIALNLGAVLTTSKRRVLVVDGDEQGTIAKWQGLSNQDCTDIYVQPKPIIDKILTQAQRIEQNEKSLTGVDVYTGTLGDG